MSESRKGIIFSEDHKNNISKANKGRIAINDGKNNKAIYPDEIDKYVELGFVRGKIKRGIK